MVEPPPGARVFMLPRRPGLADCAPSGRVRLDAIARFLQDVAYADVEDAGVAEAAVWVVRRTRLRVERFPRFAEHLELRTFCSGIGRMWAERRTSISGQEAGEVELVSLWVHLDPVSGRPTPITEAELAAWGESAGGRKVTARLRHPAPSAPNPSAPNPIAANNGVPWRFRRTECDLADHINNAAYLQPLEEELLEKELLEGDELQSIDVEIEYRSPSQAGQKRVLRQGARRWIVSSEGETHASLVVVTHHGRSEPCAPS
jgi:acyl-ACP thioesterase